MRVHADEELPAGAKSLNGQIHCRALDSLYVIEKENAIIRGCKVSRELPRAVGAPAIGDDKS